MSNLLRQNELKNTRQRQAVLSILTESKNPLTADEIYCHAVKDVHMSISTIYRILGTLSEKQILLKNLCQDGKTYYQINSHQHKHQLICTLCNQVIPIEDCPLSNLERTLSENTGFLITGHTLEFTGICPNCSNQNKSN